MKFCLEKKDEQKEIVVDHKDKGDGPSKIQSGSYDVRRVRQVDSTRSQLLI